MRYCSIHMYILINSKAKIPSLIINTLVITCFVVVNTLGSKIETKSRLNFDPLMPFPVLKLRASIINLGKIGRSGNMYM